MTEYKSNYIRIFDTTLRDGEQSPGATMNSDEKLDVAKALSRLGVDIIEAGFPAASPDDFSAVQQIAKKVGAVPRTSLHSDGTPPTICGLARATKGDIDKAAEAIAPAKVSRVHTFLATSPIHMKHKLRMEPQAVVDKAAEMVAYARSKCDEVEFSPEDAGRSEPEFLYKILDQVIQAGATTLNIPDTVGYTTPDEFGALIAGILKNVKGIENCVVSTHCHNDLGLATANTLAGIRAGARQAEVTINGIGERAGNTSLEEIAMIVSTRKQALGYRTGIDTTQLTRLSKLVSNSTGMLVQPNKAIVGANAFAHEAGIHQDGILKHQETYEIMRPETVGASASQLVLGKHSGKAAIRSRLSELGYNISDDELGRAFDRFKKLADKKKHIVDADLEALVDDERILTEVAYSLDGLQVACGTLGMSTATVRLTDKEGAEIVQAAVGTGPVDASFKAIQEILDVKFPLLEYSVHSVTEGIDALGQVTVRVASEGLSALNPQSGTPSPKTFVGHGAHTDIVVASAKAYLAALNKLLAAKGTEPLIPKANNQTETLNA